MTDWGRILIPQADGYDARQLLILAREQFGTPDDFSDQIQYDTLPSGIGGSFESIPDHENIDEIEKCMKMWTEGWKGFNIFMDKMYPLEAQPYQRPAPLGSTSGHLISDDGTLGAYITFGNVEGAVAGCWHEFGHLRLHALGIRMETYSDQFLLNHPDSRYVSSIRKDTLRPISACLHGLYAWCLLSEGHLRINDVDRVSSFLCMNVLKVEEGLEAMKVHAKLTDEGKALMQPFYDWAEDLTIRIRKALGDRLTEDHRKSLQNWKESQPVPSDHLYAEEVK